MKKFKIGVYGSAGGDKEILKATGMANKIGETIACLGHVVVTGACPGLPLAAAKTAHENKGEVWGFSPVINQKIHSRLFPEDLANVYKKIIYTPKSFPFYRMLDVGRKYRNVVSTAHADAGIIIAGRWGTMHEFCSLHDYGKVIGVLKGSGGFADELPRLLKITSKKSKAKIIFESDPIKLVELIIKELEK